MRRHYIGVINILKFYLMSKLGWEVIIENMFLGSRKFYCKNGTEFFRTADYGSEEQFLGGFMSFLKNNDVVWDIGSSIGIVSIYSAPLVDKVIAFEPDDEIFERLNKNVKLNGIECKVESFNIGISDENKRVDIYSDGVDSFSPSLMNLGKHINRKEIQVKTIDTLIKEGLTAPTVMKIDIEGAEILALRGGKDLLSSSKAPYLIFLEVHPSFLESFNSSTFEVLSTIKDYGYTIISETIRGGQIHVIAVKI